MSIERLHVKIEEDARGGQALNLEFNSGGAEFFQYELGQLWRVLMTVWRTANLQPGQN